MDIKTHVVANIQIIIVSLNGDDFHRACDGPRGRNRDFYSDFDKMLGSTIFSFPSKRLDPPPHVIVDLTNTNASEEAFKQWIRAIVFDKSSVLLHHRGKTVFCGIQGKTQWWEFEPTLEDAIHRLTDSPRLKTDLELIQGEVREIQNLAGIYLVGCPNSDIQGLTEDFARFGLDVQHGPPSKESDNVIFCVSTSDGISEGTKRAIEECRDRIFQPLCIILTSSLMVLCESLRGVVEFEERELIATIIDSEQAFELPLFQDIDPTLVSKVVKLIES